MMIRKSIKYFLILMLNFLIFPVYVHAASSENQSDSITVSSSEASEQTDKSGFGEDHFFSVNMSYLLTGLKNNGWGVGISYEKLLFPCASLRGDFSHMTLWPQTESIVLTTVGLGLEGYFFPFFKGFNYLYLGFGCKTQFIMLNGNDLTEEQKSNTVIFLFPQIGWKQNIKNYVILDASYGYNILTTENNLPEYAQNILKFGGQFDFSAKLNLEKIFHLLIKH